MDTSHRYNILSATEKAINVVQGSITLCFYIPMENGTFTHFEQNFLVLREDCELKTILLGNNFLKQNEANN